MDVKVIGNQTPNERHNLNFQRLQPLEVLIKGHQGAVEVVSKVITDAFSLAGLTVTHADHPVESGNPRLGRYVITRQIMAVQTYDNGLPVPNDEIPF